MRGGRGGEIFKRLKKMIFRFYLHAFSKHTKKKKQALYVQL